MMRATPAFADRLRSMGRLSFVAALAALAGACTSLSSAPTTFDLTAPRQNVGAAPIGLQVVVSEPTAIQTFEAERIIVKDATGSVSFLGGGQWADRLPRLVQARLIQTFENASRIKAVSRPGDRIAADYQLNTELRSFQILAETREAAVEISVRLVNDKTGRIAAARVFSARVPVPSLEAPVAAQALDKALSSVLLQIVRFVSAGAGAGAA